MRCQRSTRGTPATSASRVDCGETNTTISSEYNPLSDGHYVIPIVFHVIYRSDGTGYLSEQRIRNQVAVLNADFGGNSGRGAETGIRFELAEVRYYQNDAWFSDEGPNGTSEFKHLIAVDPTQVLNIYTNDAGGGGVLGYALLPQTAAGVSADGVVMLHEAIGGRDNGFGDFDQGRTLVHEVGHYLGLSHVFFGHGGQCANTYTSGDFILDTPPQRSADYGCSASSSCGERSALENFMNYSDDGCMDGFSREQGNRMVCSLRN